MLLVSDWGQRLKIKCARCLVSQPTADEEDESDYDEGYECFVDGVIINLKFDYTGNTG